MSVTIGRNVTFVAAAGLMSLAWIAAVPADPPTPADSSVVLVIEQPTPAEHDCPFA